MKLSVNEQVTMITSYIADELVGMAFQFHGYPALESRINEVKIASWRPSGN